MLSDPTSSGYRKDVVSAYSLSLRLSHRSRIHPSVHPPRPGQPSADSRANGRRIVPSIRPSVRPSVHRSIDSFFGTCVSSHDDNCLTCRPNTFTSFVVARLSSRSTFRSSRTRQPSIGSSELDISSLHRPSIHPFICTSRLCPSRERRHCVRSSVRIAALPSVRRSVLPVSLSVLLDLRPSFTVCLSFRLARSSCSIYRPPSVSPSC